MTAKQAEADAKLAATLTHIEDALAGWPDQVVFGKPYETRTAPSTTKPAPPVQVGRYESFQRVGATVTGRLVTPTLIPMALDGRFVYHGRVW